MSVSGQNTQTTLRQKAFYYYVKNDRLSKQTKPRKDCIREICPNWHSSGGTVFCDEYVAGWCKGYCGHGKPHDKLMVELDDVKECLQQYIMQPEVRNMKTTDELELNFTAGQIAILWKLLEELE